jgi:phosphoglycolate phosphatase
MIKNLLFDFDGTIADTFDDHVKIVGRLLKIKVTKSMLSKAQKLSLRELAEEYHVSTWKLAYFHFKGRRILKKSRKIPVVFKGMDVVLKRLSKKCNVYIVSSAPKEVIQRTLQKYGITANGILGRASLSNKSRRIKRSLKKYKLKKQETVYVGDEIRDIEACKKTRIKIISVTWGFNTMKALKKKRPSFMAHKPLDILKIVQNYNKSFK